MSGETSHQEHIGPYRLLSRLGGGAGTGAGGVHRAAGPDGRDVAIRLLPSGTVPDIERMRGVASPYVADVLDGESGGDRPYVVFRLVPGRPLLEVAAGQEPGQGPMSGGALRGMVLGLAKGLAAIHRAGLAHGDLHPGTVLVVDDAPVIIDFALSGTPAHPSADVAAWAAVVGFAATGGGTTPLPEALRPLLEAATHPDPSSRPTAAQLAEAAAVLNLPVRETPRQEPSATGPAAGQQPIATEPPSTPEAPGTRTTQGPGGVEEPVMAGGRTQGARQLAVAGGWARLLAAMVIVIAVGLAILLPVVGLALSLVAVTALRAAAARTVRGWAGAFGRTLLTVPYAAVLTVAVPLALVAVSAVGGKIDSLGACALGAGAGATVLWTAPGAGGPRRQLETMFLASARAPRRIAAAGTVLGVLALLAAVGAMSLTPSFAPMYGMQSSLESTIDRLQTSLG